MQKVIALLDIGNTEAAFDYIQSMAEVVLQHRFSFQFEKSLLLDMVRLGEQLKSICIEFAHPELFPEWLLNLRAFVEEVYRSFFCCHTAMLQCCIIKAYDKNFV